MEHTLPRVFPGNARIGLLGRSCLFWSQQRNSRLALDSCIAFAYLDNYDWAYHGERAGHFYFRW